MDNMCAEHSLENTLSLIRLLFEFQGELVWRYQVYHSPKPVYDMVESLFPQFYADQQALSFIGGLLDMYLGCLVERVSLEADLTEDEALLYCYYVVRFDADQISLLKQVDKENLYTMKSRMIRKIEKLGPQRAREYLDYLK
jgi:hypothetical protein